MSAKRLKMGVVGCGAIAQSQHLPNLREMPGLWEVAAVCDVSPSLVQMVGDRFDVPRRYTDYHELFASDVDAVILCLADPKTPAAVAAARAGKHLFIEKPMCYTVAEADEIVGAAKEAGVVAMVGYMKQHEPGYQYARRHILNMKDVRFIQVNHLHPHNSLQMQDFRVLKANDVPAEAFEPLRKIRDARIAEVLGPSFTPSERSAFGMLIGSMIHDIGNLRGIFGPPERVVSAEIWHEGRGFSTVLAYPNDVRCVATWVDLPNLWDFRETLEVYGSDERVLLSFPTGFSRGIPTTVTLQGSEGGVPWKKEIVLSRDPGFQAEIANFHRYIVEGSEPLTSAASTRHDIALVQAIVEAWRRNR